MTEENEGKIQVHPEKRLTFNNFNEHVNLNIDQENSDVQSLSENSEDYETTFIQNKNISQINTSNITGHDNIDRIFMNDQMKIDCPDDLKKSFEWSYSQVNKKSQSILDEYKKLIDEPKVTQTPHYKETRQVKSIKVLHKNNDYSSKNDSSRTISLKNIKSLSQFASRKF